MDLRPYQKEAVDSAMAEFYKGQNALIVAATGAGKSVIMASLAKFCEEKFGIRVICLVHRKTLVEQNTATFKKVGARAEVTTIQALHRRQIEHYGLVIIDEVHYLPGKSTDTMYAKALRTAKEINPKLKIAGFTATPYRLGVGYIYGHDEAWFNYPCYDIKTTMLQSMGYLCPMRYKVAQTLDTSDIDTNYNGDYVDSQLENTLVQQRHLESVVHAIPEDRTSIAIFCATIHHCEEMAKVTGGKTYHSQLSKYEKQQRLNDFRAYGGILCSVMSLTEGWDAPNCDCVVIARPTMSPALYVQIVGRALRVDPNKKEALVIDMVGCYNRHGSPYDPQILAKKEKTEAKECLRREQVCPECGLVTEEEICPECGTNIKEMNAMEGVEYLNKPVSLEEINLNAETVVTAVDCDWYKSKNGNVCLRATYFNHTGRQIANDYFALFSSKVTPKRKMRKAVRALTGHDLGSDFTPEQAYVALTSEPLLSNVNLNVEQNGKYKNVLW